ncbi:hypothetical protein EDB80DRAFT_882449 [Ilyonectria destructans]|nr:hypothetical protein EDB80DRAFT_882449 [Ilyonectria destructans]
MSEWQQEPKESIEKKTRQVKKQFQSLISHLDKSNDTENGCIHALSCTSITNALEKFVLWAGNLGAFRGPVTKLSLDHRLSNAPEIRDEISRQLDDISEAIGDLLSIILGTRENWPLTADLDTESQPSDQSQVILKVILESISSLFGIGMLVRRSTPRDRFQRALQVSDLAFPKQFDVDHVEQKHRKLRTSWLSARLGGAIAKRRQFIKYCRDHTSRLGIEDIIDDNPTAGTERMSSKATTFVPGMVPKVFETDEDDALSFVSASTMTDCSTALRLPSLADLSKDGKPFECPICFTLQSFQKERAWKKHAFRDLKAYVCTVGGSECDDLLFGDPDSWFAHEMNKHKATYNCSFCDQVRGASIDQLQSHLATHGTFNDQQLHVLEDTGRETAVNFRARDCPFCDEWAKKLHTSRGEQAKCNGLTRSHQDVVVSMVRFKRHVAAHQEQLAIFALPRATDDEQEIEQGHITRSISADDALSDVLSLRDWVSGEHDTSSHLPEPGNSEDNLDQFTEPEQLDLKEQMSLPSRNTLDKRTEISDGLAAGTTRLTRSETGGEDSNIKVSGSSVIQVPGAEIPYIDGEEMTTKPADSPTYGVRQNTSEYVSDSGMLRCPEPGCVRTFMARHDLKYVISHAFVPLDCPRLWMTDDYRS